MLSVLKITHMHKVKRRICKTSLLMSDAALFCAAYGLLRSPADSAIPLLAWSVQPGIAGGASLGELHWFIILLCMFGGMSYFYGHYSRRRLFWDDAHEILAGLGILGLLDLAAFDFSSDIHHALSRIAPWFFLAAGIPLGRSFAKRGLLAIGFWDVPTLIVGSGDNAVEAYFTLTHAKLLGYDVRGFVNLSEQHPLSADLPPAVPVLRLGLQDPINPQIDVQSEKSPFFGHHIVVAPDDMGDPSYFRVIDLLSAHGYQIDVAPPLWGLPLVGMEISHVFGREAIILHTRNSLARPVKRVLKRGVDLILALIACLVFLPLLAFLAVRIRAEDGGPLFFYQERVGYKGKTFRCIKFRSMRVNAEAALARWKDENPALWDEYQKNNFKIKNDPRVTKIGHLLRATSLDELPQIINVLKGEMSLVGPRPLLGREVETYGHAYLHYCRVRPGITGIWQISGRSNTSFMDRAHYDEWYIKNWSLWYDLVIIMKTIPAVLKRDGAY